jgi:hypothetical protein
MSGIHFVIGTIFAMVTLGSATSAQASEADASLRSDLMHVSRQRVFIGHQSVGVNLLDGINQLALTDDVPIRIVEVTSASNVKPGTIGHAFVASNGNPLQKLQSFEQVMGQQPTGLDIALVKFCFVDINKDTDVKNLFARYRATIDGLKARNPGTTFVHVTAPLTVVQGGLKSSVKQLFGQAPYGIFENMRREEYNTLLRQAYKGREPIFDLARIESTAQNGTAISVEWNGSVVPVLDSAYSSDGGHLNDVGKLRAARELITVLASIPDRPVAGKATH